MTIEKDYRINQHIRTKVRFVYLLYEDVCGFFVSNGVNLPPVWP